MQSNQLEIPIPIERHDKDRYTEELIVYELTKGIKDLQPTFFCYLPSTKKYSAMRLTSRTLLESFNFKIIY